MNCDHARERERERERERGVSKMEREREYIQTNLSTKVPISSCQLYYVAHSLVFLRLTNNVTMFPALPNSRALLFFSFLWANAWRAPVYRALLHMGCNGTSCPQWHNAMQSWSLL
jgi:hypothetical protein